MAITINNHHNTCPVVAVLVTDENCPHYAKLCCKKHNKMIQWLNEADFKAIVKHTGRFENDKGKIFDKSQIGLNGVKQRPTRHRKQQDGHLWTNIY